MKKEKGFTLVELIVVIGIIVILAAILIAALNPAELIKRARDTRRINDLAALNRALAYYLADVEYPNLTNDSPNSNARCDGGGGTKTAFLSGPAAVSVSGFTISSSTSRAVNGTGWVPVNFTLITGGSPLPQLPVDPLNDSRYVYIYACSVIGGLTYELGGRLESLRYKDLATNTIDGGNDNNTYEVGTKLDIMGTVTWP